MRDGRSSHLHLLLQESDEEDEIIDAETLQKRRDQAAMEWRKNSRMTPEDNPNFEVGGLPCVQQAYSFKTLAPGSCQS